MLQVFRPSQSGRRVSRRFASEWTGHTREGGREFEPRFLTSLFRNLAVGGGFPTPGRGVWADVAPGWMPIVLAWDNSPNVQTVNDASIWTEDLGAPSWIEYTWARTQVQLANTISDNGSSSIGAAAVTVTVDLLATITAHGDSGFFNAANGFQQAVARGFQGYDVDDGSGNPELLSGILTITYIPPAPGGFLNVGTLPNGGAGVIFQSNFSAAGVDEDGSLWVEDRSPGQVAERFYAEVNEATGVMTATANFSGLAETEAINYSIWFGVANTGVFTGPDTNVGDYSGTGRFLLSFNEWVGP